MLKANLQHKFFGSVSISLETLNLDELGDISLSYSPKSPDFEQTLSSTFKRELNRSTSPYGLRCVSYFPETDTFNSSARQLFFVLHKLKGFEVLDISPDSMVLPPLPDGAIA